MEILAKFNSSHPLIAHFNTHFEGKPSFEQSRGASEWIRTFGLVPTPELEAVLQPAAQSAGARWPHQTPRAGRSQHVLGVGLALLQSLAIQQQLREPVNLNVIPLPNQVLKTHALAKRMLKFNNAHTIYGPDYRPPTFRRDEPSQTATTATILLGANRGAGRKVGMSRRLSEPKKYQDSELYYGGLGWTSGRIEHMVLPHAAAAVHGVVVM
ncbi:hypothetical protein DFH09DRAFT_1093423 [Mycena vulgaris]|nr:hypothetical protein DFH09DRAFT_1093423 [Mycena vulgaris]